MGGGARATCRVTLTAPHGGGVVGSAEGDFEAGASEAAVTLTVERPALWGPAHAALHGLRVELCVATPCGAKFSSTRSEKT